MSRIYLAYGSNMNIEQMEYRCPRAKLLGKAVIEGWRLMFRRKRRPVATIEQEAGCTVPVVLWEITDECEQSLDSYEGYPFLYTKIDIGLDFNGKPVTAMAYVMAPGHELGAPHDDYYNTILQGYRDNGIDLAPLDEAVSYSKESR
ncbi:MAG: gamma-glutamylcyclotransferase [Bacteroidales bacterium]|nr:gamma-glutamylcyclotransferase [Bacteroidales bacterium]